MTDKQYIKVLIQDNQKLKKHMVLAQTYLGYATDAIHGFREGGDIEAIACIGDAKFELNRGLCEHDNLVEVSPGKWFCPQCNPNAYDDEPRDYPMEVLV